MLIRHDVTAVAARAATAMLPAGLATTPSCWTELTRYAPWPGEDRGRRQAGGSTRFPAWPIIHSRHRKMQIPASPAVARSSPSTDGAMAAQISGGPDTNAAIMGHLARLG